MKISIWQKLVMTSLSLVLISACNRGGSSKRIIREDAPCFEDNSELQGLDAEKQKLFYSIVTPLANMNHALVLAPDPKVTEENQKMSKSKKRIFDDLRANCVAESDKDENENLKHQTYKVGRRIEKNKKDAQKDCPIAYEQTVEPVDKEVPALADPNKPTKEFRSKIAVEWTRKSDTYYDLGPLISVNLNGLADTFWYKNSIENKIEVIESYSLSVDVDSRGVEKGTIKICHRNFQYQRFKYELTVKRIGLDLKEQPAEAKYIQMYRLKKTANGYWERDRLLRNNFYLNNILLDQAAWDALEKVRDDEIAAKQKALEESQKSIASKSAN